MSEKERAYRLVNASILVDILINIITIVVAGVLFFKQEYLALSIVLVALKIPKFK